VKKLECILATTHLDKHNEAMSLGALRSMVRQIEGKWIPVGIEHDIRHPLVGRVAEAEVVPLEDGQFGVKGSIELFEAGDVFELSTDDMRSVEIETKEVGTIEVIYDRSFRNVEGQKLITELAAITSVDFPPKEEIKKSS
jgi:hypothetical protein